MFERLGAGHDQTGIGPVHSDADNDWQPLPPRDKALGQGTGIDRDQPLGAMARPIAREPREQGIELVGRIVEREQHVLAEFGVVGVALGIAGQQRELAGEILDVVHHEGDAAVELVETAGLQQGQLAVVLGNRAGNLVPCHAQEVEVLPVELARERRAPQRDQPDQPVEMHQRHERPDRLVLRHPARRGAHFAAMVDPAPHFIEIDDETALLEKGHAVRGHGLCRHVERGPLPARGQNQIAIVRRHQQGATRAVGYVGQSLHHAGVKRGGVAGFLPAQPLPTMPLPDRAGEPQPFGAIVVAVLEEVLGHHDIEPAAQALRGDQHQHQHGRGKDKAELGEHRRPAAQPGHRLRHGDHEQHVPADDQQRERLERHGPRGRKPRLRPLAHRAHPQHAHAQQGHQRAQADQLGGHRIDEIDHRVEIEVITPDQREGPACPAHDLTLGPHGPDIEIVDQHQSPGDHQQAQDHRNLENHHLPMGLWRAVQAKAQAQDQQDRLQAFDDRQHDQHRTHRRDRLVPPVVDEQRIDQPQAGQIARHIGDQRRRVARTICRLDQRPERADQHRHDRSQPDRARARCVMPPPIPLDLPAPQHERGKGRQHEAPLAQPRPACQPRPF